MSLGLSYFIITKIPCHYFEIITHCLKFSNWNDRNILSKKIEMFSFYFVTSTVPQSGTQCVVLKSSITWAWQQISPTRWPPWRLTVARHWMYVLAMETGGALASSLVRCSVSWEKRAGLQQGTRWPRAKMERFLTAILELVSWRREGWILGLSERCLF